MTDNERQRFEAWAAGSQYKLDVTPGVGESSYKYYGSDVAWAAWQAAIGSKNQIDTQARTCDTQDPGGRNMQTLKTMSASIAAESDVGIGEELILEIILALLSQWCLKNATAEQAQKWIARHPQLSQTLIRIEIRKRIDLEREARNDLATDIFEAALSLSGEELKKVYAEARATT